jgi:hypothetical protein
VLSPEQLREFSKVHLHYEIDMCHRAAALLPGAAPEHVLNNVLVESYALHLRNLIEFLYWPPTRDDVNAVHFVRSETEWVSSRGPTPEILATAKTRADKQIAHLTEKRFADGSPEKNWTPGVEITALVDALRIFLAQADPGRLHSVVGDATARLEGLVRRTPDAEMPSEFLAEQSGLRPRIDVGTTAPTRPFNSEGPM